MGFSLQCGLSQTDHLRGDYPLKITYLKADNSHSCHNFKKVVNWCPFTNIS
jgi:hypothetical protein